MHAWQELSSFLDHEQAKDLLRVLTCGSVDDGKSTLIGRLLWESQNCPQDLAQALYDESLKFGTQGTDLDFALLVDGLAAEREQGITIDVAYRYFSTARRHFILADTPGHEQYTRNMITGASTSDLAIVLIDARKGMMPQTRRHAYLASLMGIRHIVLAVNKMDLIAFDPTAFARVCEAFMAYATTLNLNVQAIPMCALQGDNVLERSLKMPWYDGPALLEHLETVKIDRPSSDRFVFPIQWVNRPSPDFRGYSGTVVEGRVRVGDELRVTANGQRAKVKSIVTMDGPQQEARTNEAVTLCLDREIDASRGNVLSLNALPLERTDQFEAAVIWMHEEVGMPGRTYDIKLATQWAQASITSIKYRVNSHSFEHESSKRLERNDIARCNLALSRPLVYDAYERTPALGGFILVDRFTRATVAAGLIRHGLRRAQNVHPHAMTVTRADRAKLNGHVGKVIWFTGLSGSGKSTLANALDAELCRLGLRSYVLDGDNVRQGLNKDLGFTEEDRVENIRRIAEVANLMADAGLIVLTAFISPFERERSMARARIGQDHFLEVYVNTPLDECERRDPKGLYRKARAGEIPNMTGIDSPYEPPQNPAYSTTSEKTLAQTVQELVALALKNTA